MVEKELDELRVVYQEVVKAIPEKEFKALGKELFFHQAIAELTAEPILSYFRVNHLLGRKAKGLE